MKRRTVQILLALFLIIYRKTWFWWIFNHFAGRLEPASREFFQILSFLKDSPWYGDVLLSACVFGYVHVSSGLTPLAFFTYASGGAIYAFLYRKTHSLYYPILLHIMINIIAFWELWVLLFSGR